MKEDWEYISTVFPGKDAQNCKFKWLSIIFDYNIKFDWSNVEDKLLILLVR